MEITYFKCDLCKEEKPHRGTFIVTFPSIHIDALNVEGKRVSSRNCKIPVEHVSRLSLFQLGEISKHNQQPGTEPLGATFDTEGAGDTEHVNGSTIRICEDCAKKLETNMHMMLDGFMAMFCRTLDDIRRGITRNNETGKITEQNDSLPTADLNSGTQEEK